MNPNDKNTWKIFSPAVSTPTFAGGTQAPVSQAPVSQTPFVLFQQRPFSSNIFSSSVFGSSVFGSPSTSETVSGVTFTDLSHKQTIHQFKPLKLVLPRERLEDKVTGLLRLSYMLLADEALVAAEAIHQQSSLQQFTLQHFDVKTIGLHALVKLDEINLRQKLSVLPKEEFDIAFVLINLLYALIEESVQTPDDIYGLAIQLASNNKTLVYALRLVREQHRTGRLEPDFLGEPSHLECLVLALFIFVQFNNKPLEAVEESFKFDRGVQRFCIWMLAASYGNLWIREEWGKFTPPIQVLVDKFVSLNL